MAAKRGNVPPGNRLLGRLPASERRLLAAASEVSVLGPGEVICRAGANPTHVYFPREGVVSLYADVAEGAHVGVGLVRRDGVFGAHAVGSRTRSNLLAVSQGAGRGDRIEARAFVGLLSRCPGLQSALLRDLQEGLLQLAQNVACLALHSSRQRLARWMIDATEEAGGAGEPGFVATQAALAATLGLQRPAVSHLAADLQRSGLIRYVRGRVTVVDRPGLRAMACGCTRGASGGP